MKVPFVDLGAQYRSIQHEIDDAIRGVLDKGDFILGEALRLFEAEFARFCGTRYAIGVSSGTEALRLALVALGIGPGDEVITAANTYIATVEAILHVGATPVLIDVSPASYNIDAQAIETAITARTRAILPVHLYGQPADMTPILDIARQKGLKVVEDACQAHGATYKGRKAGAIGDVGCFSFYPSKNLGAYGDGGMVVTDDPVVAERVVLARNHGQKVKYYHIELGSTSRLDTIQAAALRTKLKYLEQWNEQRRRAAAAYRELLAAISIEPPHEEADRQHVYHLFVVAVDDRDNLQTCLARHGVDTGIHYPVPVHMQQVYRSACGGDRHYPITERLAGRILSLPMFAEIRQDQMEHVVDSIARFYGVAPAGHASGARRQPER